MSTSSLTLGVIGPGTAYRSLHLPILATMGATVAWIAGTDEGRLQEARALTENSGAGNPAIYTDYESAISQSSTEAILVAVPMNLTEKVTRDALAAGVPVLAEKPLAETYQGALSLISDFKAAGVPLMVGENFRYQRKFPQIKEIVEAGRIGRPQLYFLNDLHFTPSDGIYAKTTWRRTGNYRGGYLYDGGTHIVAGLRCMVDPEVRSVHALMTSIHPEYLSQQADTLLINLSFVNGMVGHLALGYGVVDRESRTPKIYGEEGTIALTRTGIELWTPEKSETLTPVDKSDNGYAVNGKYSHLRSRGIRQVCAESQTI